MAELRAHPAQQSYVLSAAVAAFADAASDSARLARTVPIADAYAVRLAAWPATGLRGQGDSLAVLKWQRIADDTLLEAYRILGDTARLLARARHAVTHVARLGLLQRADVMRSVYGRLVVALREDAARRSQLGAFEVTLRAAAAQAGRMLPAGTPPSQRATASRAITESVQQQITSAHESLALLDASAPPIVAHAWLNTPDSAYRPTPTTRSFHDGKVHVLLFGSVYDNPRLDILDRLRRRVLGIETLLILSTNGFVGPDILTPADEVAWLDRYLVAHRHLVTPIAVWAGARVAEPSGWSHVEPTPNTAAYHEGWLGMSCVVIDRRGIVRAYLDLSTRAREAQAARAIAAIVAESASPTP